MLQLSLFTDERFEKVMVVQSFCIDAVFDSAGCRRTLSCPEKLVPGASM